MCTIRVMQKERRKTAENPSKSASLHHCTPQPKKTMNDDNTTSDDGCNVTNISVAEVEPVNNGKKVTKATRCSLCLATGHNLRTCPQRKRQGT